MPTVASERNIESNREEIMMSDYIPGADVTMLYKQTLNTLAPVLAMTCHEHMTAFNAKKKAGAHPFETAKEQDSVLSCARATVRYVQAEHAKELENLEKCLKANKGSQANCATVRDELSKAVLKNLDKIQSQR